MFLEALRNSADKPVAKILIGILIFSFVGWGVASWIFGESSVDNTLVRVGGHPITVTDFENERNLQLSALSREDQRQIYSDRAAAHYFFEQILSKLTTDAMLLARADDLGFGVSTGAVADVIHRTPEFQENGRFSLEKFDAILAASGMTEDYYSNAVRRQILRDTVLAGVTDYVPVPSFAARAAYNTRHAMRKIAYKTIPYADFAVVGDPTDANLGEVYAKNPKMIPEYRTVSYVLVPVSDMRDPDQYDRGFGIAQKLEDAIIGGESMAVAAQKNKARFVDLGRFAADGKKPTGDAVHDPLVDDKRLADLFAMDAGLESEVMETKSGFAIFRVEAIEASHAAPIESIRPELIKQWRVEEQKKQAYIKANEVLTALNAGGTPEMASVTVGRMTGAAPDILVAAFANRVGVNTIVPGQNAFHVLSVKGDIPPKEDAAGSRALKKEAANTLARVLLDDYSAFLSRQYPVKVNAKTYKRLFGAQ